MDKVVGEGVAAARERRGREGGAVTPREEYFGELERAQ
jgi:hypothetical protein